MNYKPKGISDKNKISMLMPTRGRPEKLDAALRQFDATVHHHHLFDAWIYVDEDDGITREYIDSGCWKNMGYKVNWVIKPGTLTIGQMCNTLWQQCTTNSGIYLPFVDDYAMQTPCWDDILRSTFDQFPDRIGLAHIPDTNNDHDDVTILALSAEWLNAVGYVLTEYFVTWYDDIWLGEISKMVGRIIKVPIVVEASGGRGNSPRLRNLKFWNHFYMNLLDERIDAANRIYEIITGRKEVFIDESHPLVSQFKNSRQYQTSDADLIKIEADLSVPEYYENVTKFFRYSTIELQAISHICYKIENYAKQRDFIRVQSLMDNLKHASVSIDKLDLLLAKVISSCDASIATPPTHGQEMINLSKYELLLRDKAAMMSRITAERTSK